MEDLANSEKLYKMVIDIGGETRQVRAMDEAMGRPRGLQRLPQVQGPI